MNTTTTLLPIKAILAVILIIASVGCMQMCGGIDIDASLTNPLLFNASDSVSWGNGWK